MQKKYFIFLFMMIFLISFSNGYYFDLTQNFNDTSFNYYYYGFGVYGIQTYTLQNYSLFYPKVTATKGNNYHSYIMQDRNSSYGQLNNDRDQITYTSIFLCNPSLYSNCYLTPKTLLNFKFDSGTISNTVFNSDISMKSGFYFNNSPVFIFYTKSGDIGQENYNFSLSRLCSNFDSCIFSLEQSLINNSRYSFFNITQRVDEFRIGIQNYYLPENYYLKEFSIYNLSTLNYYDSNQLPIFNFSVTPVYQSVCNNTAITNFNFNINSYDNEGDTIYYATSTIDSYQDTKIKFNDFKTLGFLTCNAGTILCNSYPNFNFGSKLLGAYGSNQVCKLGNNENYTDLKNMNLIKFSDSVGTELIDIPSNTPNYQLMIDGKYCVGEPSFYYDIGTTNKRITYTGLIYGLDNGETYNFTLKDTFFNNVVNLGFERTDNRIEIYNYNNSIKNLIANESYTLLNPNGLGIVLNTFSDNNNLELNIVYGTITKLYNTQIYNNNNNFMRFIGITVSNNTDVFITEFKYGAYKNILNFTTTKPIETTLQGITTGSYTLYVSDSVHYPNDYSQKTVNYQNVNCQFFLNGTGFNTTISNYTNLPVWNIGVAPVDTFLNGLTFLYPILFNLHILEGLLWGVKIGMVIFLFRYYKRETEKGRTSQEVIRSMFIVATGLSTLFFMMGLIEKSFFVTFSTLGCLYLSNELANLMGVSNSAETDKLIIFNIAMSNVLLFVWFNLWQYASGLNFGIPIFPSLDISSLNFVNAPVLLFNFIVGIFGYIYGMLNVSIIGLPSFLNFFLILYRLFGVFSLILLIKDWIPFVNGSG